MKRALSLILVLLLMVSALAGCGSKGTTATQTETKTEAKAETKTETKTEAKTETKTETKTDSQPAAAETKKKPADNVFRFATSTSAMNVCPFENYTSIMDYIQAKFYRYIPNEDGTAAILVPDLAVGEPTTEDGYTWIIRINPEAKWANGEPINADTFMYSWKEALDPTRVHPAPSGLARNIIEVENAYAYYTQASTGVAVAWEDVGFKKVDEYTVSVKAIDIYSPTQVMQHFQMRHTGPVYEPLFEAGMDAGRTATNYGTEAEYFMSSGPMKLVSWTKDNEAVFEKNEYYCHADEVSLDGMVCRIVKDESTQLQLFQAGDIDVIQLGTNGLEVYGEDPGLIEYKTSTIREIEFNFENPDKPFLGNLNFRKAFYYAVDRATIAKLANYSPAPYFLPGIYSTMADGTSFRSLPEAQAYVPENNGYNPTLALEYFDKALAELGISKIEVNLIYNEAVAATRLASENIQSSLTKLFGEDRFSMTLTAMNNSEAVKLMRTSQKGPTNGWDLCWGGWDLTAARYSPNRKFEVYTSTDSRRFTNYNNATIDEIYRLSTTAEYRMDEKKMTEACIEMEKAYLDNVLACPVFAQVQYYLFSERVDMVAKEYLNFIDFAYPYQAIVAD